MEIFKWFVICLLISFSAYSFYIAFKESFWKTLKEILKRRWGRQIFTDLAIGIVLFHFFVYLHEGSMWITLAWFGASVLLGNITTMIYLVLNFESIVARFLN